MKIKSSFCIIMFHFIVSPFVYSLFVNLCKLLLQSSIAFTSWEKSHWQDFMKSWFHSFFLPSKTQQVFTDFENPFTVFDQSDSYNFFLLIILWVFQPYFWNYCQQVSFIFSNDLSVLFIFSVCKKINSIILKTVLQKQFFIGRIFMDFIKFLNYFSYSTSKCFSIVTFLYKV